MYLCDALKHNTHSPNIFSHVYYVRKIVEFATAINYIFKSPIQNNNRRTKKYHIKKSNKQYRNQIANIHICMVILRELGN